MFVISLQAGLSALKTHMCYQPDNQNIHCPVCSKSSASSSSLNNTMTTSATVGGGGGVIGKLAENLPMAHHVNSCIVCRVNGTIMNEDNPPLVLPNGMVYSTMVKKI